MKDLDDIIYEKDRSIQVKELENKKLQYKIDQHNLSIDQIK